MSNSVIAKDLARHQKDVGSPEYQAAQLTERIAVISQHLKVAKKDYMARRGLLQLVGQRRRLLDYLKRTDLDVYQKTIKQLGLRR